MKKSRVKRTDFYEIVPYLDNYIIILGDVVVGAYTFSSIDKAEEFVILHYYDLFEPGLIPMRRLLNIILLFILIYIVYLAYKGDGVVDFNEVISRLTPLIDTFKAWFCEFFAKFEV